MVPDHKVIQSRTKQDRTEQTKTGPDRTGQNRPKQNITEQNMGNTQTVKSKYHHTTLNYGGRWYRNDNPYFKYTLHTLNLITGDEKSEIIEKWTSKNPSLIMKKSGDYMVVLSTASWAETYVVASPKEIADHNKCAPPKE